MAKPRKTVPIEEYNSLQHNHGALLAAFVCLRKGEVPVKLSVLDPYIGETEDEQRYEVELYGLSRLSGGIVIDHECVSYVTDWTARMLQHPSAYMQDLAHRVQRECVKAANEPKPRRS